MNTFYSPDPKCNDPVIQFCCCKRPILGDTWSKLANIVPPNPSGNAYPKLRPPAFGLTPFPLPKTPYEPKTSSITRPKWEGWRYGSNYVKTDEIDRPYGFPDYHYYRGNYCGPCCPCVAGTNPPLLGDPNGKNPNIRYIPLDFNSLLGSGFACQGRVPMSQYSPLGFQTSCGQDHCTECSGVYKKRDQPVKFQVCIGDREDPRTVQPCPVQPMKIYLPLSVLPPCKQEDGEGEEKDGGGGGDADNCEDGSRKPPKQLYEVFVPGQEFGYNQFGKPDTTKVVNPLKSPYDPCGTCTACNYKTKPNC